MVDLVDTHGRPIRRADLVREPQTARLGHLHGEFADHPTRGLTPAKLARILEDAERGDLVAQARLGQDMEEKDPHLYAELWKRRQAVLTVPWELRPPPQATAQEEQETERLKAMIQALDAEALLFDLTDAVLHAYANIEITWDRSEGEWRIEALDHRPPDWFMARAEAREELLLRSADGLGEPLRPWGWIAHHHRSRSGYLVRAGLARVLAWPFLFRALSTRDMAEFLEIYGLPLRLGTYPNGASDKEKATLMQAVVGIGHAAAGIIPEGMRIEFQEAAKGAADPFQAMTAWAERSMSKAILGGTLTSQTDGGGAYALGEIHEQVRQDILESDLRQIGRTLTRQLVTPLARLNTRLTRMPEWVFDTESPEDLGQYAEAVPKLVDVGARIPVRWLHEKLRIPEAQEDEAVLARADPFGGMGFGAGVTRLAALRQAPASPAPAELMAERLAQDAQPAVAEWLERIEAMLESAASLEEFREMLLAALPELPAERFAQAMAAGIQAAEAAAWSDTEDEAGE